MDFNTLISPGVCSGAFFFNVFGDDMKLLIFSDVGSSCGLIR